MRWVRLFFRVFGWLLTPFMAWAASFFGCVAGAMLAARIEDPVTGLIITAVAGGIAGFVAVILWLRLVRSSPEIQEALAVTEEGVPDTAAFAVQAQTNPAEPAASVTGAPSADRPPVSS